MVFIVSLRSWKRCKRRIIRRRRRAHHLCGALEGITAHLKRERERKREGERPRRTRVTWVGVDEITGSLIVKDPLHCTNQRLKRQWKRHWNIQPQPLSPGRKTERTEENGWNSAQSESKCALNNIHSGIGWSVAQIRRTILVFRPRLLLLINNHQPLHSREKRRKNTQMKLI